MVPDADWATNRQVERQALKVRTLLRRIGIECHVCSPPLEAGRKGIDDFLGAGYALGDLVIEGREVDSELISDAVSHLPYQRRPSAERALEDLALYVRDDGSLRAASKPCGTCWARTRTPSASCRCSSPSSTPSRSRTDRWRLSPRHDSSGGTPRPCGKHANHPMDPNFIAWAKRAKLTALDFEVDSMRAELEALKAKVHEIQSR